MTVEADRARADRLCAALRLLIVGRGVEEAAELLERINRALAMADAAAAIEPTTVLH